MAWAARRFVNSLLKAQSSPGIVESAYVYIGQDSTIENLAQARQVAGPACSYLAVDVELGKLGAHAVQSVSLNAFEQRLLARAVDELKTSVAKGIDFVHASKL